MTAEEQAIVDAVSGTLAGDVQQLRGGHWINKGEQFAVSVRRPRSADDADVYPFADVRNLLARHSGWVKGVVYLGNEPVDLVIETAETPFD